MIRRLMSLDRKVWIKVWIAVILLALLVVSGGVAFTLQPFRDKHVDDAARQEDLTASIAASEEVQPAKNPLPPGVEEPYCDCLADKLRPPADWLPTRYSKSLWALRELPTSEEIKEYQERERKQNLKPQSSKEFLMSHAMIPAMDGAAHPVTEPRADWNALVGFTEKPSFVKGYYDPQTYIDRIRFEYLGPDYYKGPIPGSRVEEAFMERYAVSSVSPDENPIAWSPEFLQRTGGKPLKDAPDAYDPEAGLLWDQLSPDVQWISPLSFSTGEFSRVILLDYKLDEKGHLKEFTFRPVGHRESFRVHIANPIESFILNRFWSGFPWYDKNTAPMLPANKENEQYLQDLIRYRQPVLIRLADSFPRRTPMEWIRWTKNEEYIHAYDPMDNKVVFEATIPKKGIPNTFVRYYYGGDFVFELSERAFDSIRMFITQAEIQPELAEKFLKEKPEETKEKIEKQWNVAWTGFKDFNRKKEGLYTYNYSLRERLVLLAPPFTGIKEYNGPIKFPYENNPEWKKDPKGFSREYGFSYTGYPFN